MLFSLGSKQAAHDQPPVVLSPVPRPRRARIGLALGGGAARGWAHIGVIQELAARGIDVDVIAGTSIGAVVGACHAAGRLDALDRFARRLNRRRMITLMDLSFAGTGLMAGVRLKRRLSRDLGGLTIEGLGLPFAAVATEFGTGREICLTEGDVVEAIRASYALPGIFEPVRVGGRWLFDGTMSNPVPVSVCRSLGADLVIAVNLTADLARRGVGLQNAVGEPTEAIDVGADVLVTGGLDSAPSDLVAALGDPAMVASATRKPSRIRRLKLLRRRLFTRRANGAPGIASVMVGAFSIAQERISRSRLAIDPPDVSINARLRSVGIFDFHRAAELIDYGRVVTRQALPEIEARMEAADCSRRSR